VVVPLLTLPLCAVATPQQQQQPPKRSIPQTTDRRDVVTDKLKDLASDRRAPTQSDLGRTTTSMTPDLGAVEKLLKPKDPQAASKLARLVDHPDPKVATQACTALGESGDPSFSPFAVRGLGRESDSSVSEACATALGKLNAPEGIAALNRVAQSDQQPVNVRLAAIHALSRTAPERASSLVALLTNSDRRIRAAAAYSSCQLRMKDAVPGVAALAIDPDPEVRQAAIDAMSLWPEAFSKELLSVASNQKEMEDNRILGLTALDAFPAELKSAALVKAIPTLLDLQQPRDVQLASVQLLSKVPEARPAFEQFSQKPGVLPEVVSQIEAVGIQPDYTAAKEASASYRKILGDYSPAWIALLGALVGGLLSIGGNLLLEGFKQRAKKKKDEPRKKILREMLRDERFPEGWRKLRTLMHVIGANEETTKRLLIEIGARGSEDGEDLWGLIVWKKGLTPQEQAQRKKEEALAERIEKLSRVCILEAIRKKLPDVLSRLDLESWQQRARSTRGRARNRGGAASIDGLPTMGRCLLVGDNSRFLEPACGSDTNERGNYAENRVGNIVPRSTPFSALPVDAVDLRLRSASSLTRKTMI
jgi:HEAT repeat protein